MTRRGTARVEGYALLAAVSLVGALALRRPELAVVAAPFVLLLVAGTRFMPTPDVEATLSVSTSRTLENDDVDAVLTLASGSAIGRLEVVLDLPDGVDVVDGAPAFGLRLGAGEERAVPLTLRCSRWGVFDVGGLELRATDVFRIVTWEQRLDERLMLKAYPRLEAVQRVVSARETQAFAGNEVSRHPGEGIEYADLRDFVTRPRSRSSSSTGCSMRSGRRSLALI